MSKDANLDEKPCHFEMQNDMVLERVNVNTLILILNKIAK